MSIIAQKFTSKSKDGTSEICFCVSKLRKRKQLLTDSNRRSFAQIKPWDKQVYSFDYEASN